MSSFPGGASMDNSPWRTSLSASVLSPRAASYTAYLQRRGYSATITVAYLHAVGHFAHWLTETRLTLRRLDELVVGRFLTTHLPTCCGQGLWAGRGRGLSHKGSSVNRAKRG